MSQNQFEDADKMPGTQFGQFLKGSDFARLLNISKTTFERWKSACKIPKPVTFGRTRRWNRAEIEQWIAEGCPRPLARDNVARRR